MIKSSDLANREGLGQAADPANGRPAKPTESKEAQQALTARIAKAKTLEPKGAEAHCRDCWQRGRNAAIRVIEGGDG